MPGLYAKVHHEILDNIDNDNQVRSRALEIPAGNDGHFNYLKHRINNEYNEKKGKAPTVKQSKNDEDDDDYVPTTRYHNHNITFELLYGAIGYLKTHVE